MRRRRLTAALCAAIVLVGLAATGVSAHAVLVRTSPVDGETWLVAPTEVLVAFDEAVTAPVGAIRVFDAQGHRVDLGRVDLIEGGTTMVAPLRDDLAPGTHIVTWRAVSEDGHPIKGAFIFHIEEEGDPIDESFVSSLLGSSRDRPFAFAAGVARWISYLAALLTIGGFVFVALISRDPHDRGPILRLVRVACVAGAAASVIQIPLFAAETTGLGFSALTSSAAWGDALSSTVGVAALLRAGGFVIMLVAATLSWPALAWLAVASLVVAESVTGHTRTTDPAWLLWLADAVHVAAASVWFGGLAAMLITWRHRRAEDPAAVAGVVGRFSVIAVWSVLALAVAGGVLAWAEVRALHALTSTPYGWTLLAKLVIVGAVVAIAVYNNRVLVPAIGGGGDDAESGWTRLGRTVRWELLGIVAAVAVTAFLVNLQPAAEAAGVSAPYSTFAPFGDGEVNVVVDPNRVGENEIHLFFFAPGGSLADADGEVTLELALPSEDIGPIVRLPQFAGSGHWYHAGGELALSGAWQITVRQRVSEFREEVAVVSVVVNG
jgi:copper transport protein